MLSASLLIGAGAAASAATAVATFAGGCFWCVESDFDQVPGVLKTESGYTGGTLKDPTYETVTQGGTGHYEAVRITYDPDKVTYDKLLDVFWHSVDPTDDGGQFCDRGESYKTAVFFNSPEQERAAIASKQAVGKSGELKGSIVPILMAKILPGRGIPPGLLHEEPAALPLLPLWLRPRQAPARGLGRERAARDREEVGGGRVTREPYRYAAASLRRVPTRCRGRVAAVPANGFEARLR